MINSWNKIKPNEAADERMLDNILTYNRSQNSKEEEVNKMNRKFNWKIFGPVIACTVLVVGLLFFMINNNDSGTPLSDENEALDGVELDLKQSSGVKVKFVDAPPIVGAESKLEWLTEEELFAPEYNGAEVVAFEGEVQTVRNIVIELERYDEYRAIAEIEVTEVLRGNLEQGSTVEVLLYGPVSEAANMGISSQISKGTKGVFFPVKLDEKWVVEMSDNKKLFYSDIANYGFADGSRWMFLELTNGVLFDSQAYPSFEIGQDLHDVKELIKEKIK